MSEAAKRAWIVIAIVVAVPLLMGLIVLLGKYLASDPWGFWAGIAAMLACLWCLVYFTERRR